jgi:hypothetical protein
MRNKSSALFSRSHANIAVSEPLSHQPPEAYGNRTVHPSKLTLQSHRSNTKTKSTKINSRSSNKICKNSSISFQGTRNTIGSHTNKESDIWEQAMVQQPTYVHIIDAPRVRPKTTKKEKNRMVNHTFEQQAKKLT